VRAETTDEALGLAAGHVQSVHGITDVTRDLIDAVVARIQDVRPLIAPAS
jgi:predicted small metal-binding protein